MTVGWGRKAWANGSDWGGDGMVIRGTVNVWGDPVFTCADALCVSHTVSALAARRSTWV